MTARRLGILTAIFTFFMVMLFATRPAWAVVGTVTVKVTDPMGTPVPGAKITLTPADPALPTKEAETDKDGSLIIPSVEQGSYTLRVAADDRVAVRDVTVRGGEITSVDVSVLPARPAPSLVEQIFRPVERVPEDRFRWEVQGEWITQRRSLEGNFDISEYFERETLCTCTVFTGHEREKVTHLRERAQLALGLLKLYYRVTDRIELHAGIGTGALHTKIENARGVFSAEGFLDSSQVTDFSARIAVPGTHRGTGDAGFAGRAGASYVAWQSRNPHLSLILSAAWTYLRSDNILKINSDIEIDKSQTHMVDAGMMARYQRGRVGLHAGVKAIWLLTEYQGTFTRVERIEGETTRTRKPFSFDVEPKTFPIVGAGGLDYFLTDSLGLTFEGAAGNSHTYSVMGGLFYQF